MALKQIDFNDLPEELLAFASELVGPGLAFFTYVDKRDGVKRDVSVDLEGSFQISEVAGQANFKGNIVFKRNGETQLVIPYKGGGVKKNQPPGDI